MKMWKLVGKIIMDIFSICSQESTMYKDSENVIILKLRNFLSKKQIK